MAEKAAVVTGAEGFIGSFLVRELIDAGWSVVALHRPDAGLWRLHGFSVEQRPCDMTRTDDLAKAIPRGARVLFHLAAARRISGWRRWHAQRPERADRERRGALETQVGYFRTKYSGEIDSPTRSRKIEPR